LIWSGGNQDGSRPVNKTSIKITLTPQESCELRLVVRRQRAQHREVVRAQMILLLASGESFAATSQKVGKARRIVYKWAKRFLVARIAGLKDKPRSGRPARFSPDRVDVADQARV
jgi:hypothetical protein